MGIKTFMSNKKILLPIFLLLICLVQVQLWHKLKD